jgi:hypothetical protein
MTAATMIGIFIVPVFYVILQGLADRFSKPGGSPSSAREAGTESGA